MQRRHVVAGLLTSASAVLAAERSSGQARPANLRVGIITGNPRTTPQWGAFIARLRELGYAEGQNLHLDFVDLIDPGRTLDQKIAEMLRGQPQIVVASGPEIVLKSAMASTKTLPIVMVAVDYDPIALGYVASLSRPTGNVTGVFLQQIDLVLKRLEFMQEALPHIRKAAILFDQFSSDQWEAIRRAQRAGVLDLIGIELRDPPYDYERALVQIPSDYRGMLLLMTSPVFFRDRAALAALALGLRIPTTFAFRPWADAGGLMSYGPSMNVMWRRAAEYVDRLARGVRPAELPIEQPSTFELVINQRTADALGIVLPAALLARADEVID
jgi:putative tryptophan/tyrosine transport system substrate-binding protein